MLKCFVPGMIARKSGHVVNIASSAGFIGAPYLPGYASSKFAVVGLHESIETEFASTGGWAPSMTLVMPHFINGTNMAQGGQKS